MQLARAVTYIGVAIPLAFGLSLTAAASPAGIGFIHALSEKAAAPVVLVDQKSGNLSYHKRRQHVLGYRGYAKYRPGYRWYEGWWYPPDVFRFGFNVVPPPREIIRPPLDLSPPTHLPYVVTDVPAPAVSKTGPDPAHLHWCDQRYRSYRASDNSFQPYQGPRRACRSPYGP